MKKTLFLTAVIIIAMCTSCTSGNETSSDNVQDESTAAEPVTMVPKSALTVCAADGYIYYVALGGDEGFHRMDMESLEDIVIHDHDGIDIDGSTAVTSEYEDGYIIFTFTKLAQFDGSGNSTKSSADVSYRLNISDNSLELM